MRLTFKSWKLPCLGPTVAGIGKVLAGRERPASLHSCSSSRELWEPLLDGSGDGSVEVVEMVPDSVTSGLSSSTGLALEESSGSALLGIFSVILGCDGLEDSSLRVVSDGEELPWCAFS